MFGYVWWAILLACNIFGFIQLVGYYGTGSKSKIIEYLSNAIILFLFAYSFYEFGLMAGFIITIATIAINTLIGKPIIRYLFIRWIGYVPRDRSDKDEQF